MLQYKNKALIEIADFLAYDEEGDCDKALHSAGFTPLQQFGNEHGVGVLLWERNKPEWIAVYSTTCFGTDVYLDSWIDLIEFLALVSSTMLASLAEEV